MLRDQHSFPTRRSSDLSSPDLERGIRIKTNSIRGGVIENFYIRNITIGEVKTALVIDFHYEEGDRSEEHTSELQSRPHLVCRLLLEKKKTNLHTRSPII